MSTQDAADATARQTIADIRHGPPRLFRARQADGMVKLEEPFAAAGEWLAVEPALLIAKEDCQ